MISNDACCCVLGTIQWSCCRKSSVQLFLIGTEHIDTVIFIEDIPRNTIDQGDRSNAGKDEIRTNLLVIVQQLLANAKSEQECLL